MIVIFVEFIDELIDYPINRANPRKICAYTGKSEKVNTNQEKSGSFIYFLLQKGG